jgi:hypothetical protein
MLQFPYRQEPIHGPPPPSLPPSATVRWRPLVPVTIIGPTGTRHFFPRALLDLGADDTVFPDLPAELSVCGGVADCGYWAHNGRICKKRT